MPAAGLHTASARLPVEGELPSFGGATGWLNSPPLTAAGLSGKSSSSTSGPLPASTGYASVPMCTPGCEILRPGTGGRRRAYARVRVREECRERQPGRAGDEDQLPGRDRQRLCGMGCFRQSLLAGPLFRGRRRADPASPLSAKANTSSRKWSSNNCWPRPDPPAQVVSWCPSMPVVPTSPPTGPA
jgi:hypothetical protein